MTANKIVLLSSVPLAEPVTRNRLLPFLALLLDAGINVILICPKSDPATHAHPEGITLVEVEQEITKPKSFIKRAIKETQDVSALLSIAKQEQAAAYLLTMPSIFIAFLAPLYLRKKPVFLDIRDLTWEYLSNKSILQRISKRFFGFLFKITLNCYQQIAVTNPAELVYVKRIWKGAQEPLLVSNGITQEQFKKLETTRVAKNEKLIITYIGNIGIAQHLETFVEAAKALPDVTFRVVGAGIEQEKIQQLILDWNINNFELTGRVPWDRVKDYYSSTNILYAQLAPDFAGAMPSKLYEYLSTGKYIIYGGIGQAADKLSEFSNNKVVYPCDTPALVKAIKETAEQIDLNQLCSKNRNAIEKNYIRENTAKKFIDQVVLAVK